MRLPLYLAIGAVCCVVIAADSHEGNTPTAETPMRQPASVAPRLPIVDSGAQKQPVRVRKAVETLTAQEKKDLVEAIIRLKQTPSPYEKGLSYYDQFVQWHLLSVSCPNHEHPGTPYPAHMGPGFLPWHRLHLLLFEEALRQVSKKDIALCYWDWTNQKSTAAVFSDDFMGPNGDPDQDYAVVSGPFRKGQWCLAILSPESDDPGQFRHLTRAFGTDPRAPSLPTNVDVQGALALPSYDVAPWDITSDVRKSFRNCLEGWQQYKGKKCVDGIEQPDPDAPFSRSILHNQVHLWVAGKFKYKGNDAVGTMNPSPSPNDPVFWLHHAYVDKLWVDWAKRHGDLYDPGAAPKGILGLNDKISPFGAIKIKQGMPAGIEEIVRRSSPAGVLRTSDLGYRYDR